MNAPNRIGWVIVSTMAATIMQALDTTIANVALPHMQGSLNATQDQISWVLTSYIVACAIMTAPTGILAAKVGRKRLFLICVSGFTFTSVLCGLAQTLNQMVLFRLLQGIFGAGLVPLSQAVMLDIFPKEKHGQAMSMWSMGVMLGPILGPTLGGWITQYYHWRWVFFINVPVGILTVIGISVFMQETEKDKIRRFDTFGFILLGLSIGALQLLLDRGQHEDWFNSTEIIVECVTAGLTLYLFLVHIMTARSHPFLEPSMFRDRNFTASLAFIFVVGIVLLASMALLPPFLQNLMGYPVITTGLLLAPRGLGSMCAMLLAGRVIRYLDARLMIFAGLLITSFALWEISQFTSFVPESIIVRNGLMQGFGLGFIFVPLSTTAYSTLAAHFRNEAAAMFSLIRNIGSSVGISVVTTLLARNIQINHAELASHLVSYGSSAGMVDSAINDLGSLGASGVKQILNGMVNEQAATISYLNDFRLMTVIVLMLAPLILLMKKNPYQMRARESMAMD